MEYVFKEYNGCRSHSHFIFKYSVLINLWFYSLYIVWQYAGDFFVLIFSGYDQKFYSPDFLVSLTMLSVTFAIGFILPRVKYISE